MKICNIKFQKVKLVSLTINLQLLAAMQYHYNTMERSVLLFDPKFRFHKINPRQKAVIRARKHKWLTQKFPPFIINSPYHLFVWAQAINVGYKSKIFISYSTQSKIIETNQETALVPYKKYIILTEITKIFKFYYLR